MALNTPVAFLIFNRPDKSALVFAEIAKAKPPKLLVVADGPRTNRPGEAEKCQATRALIKQVDWDCEVLCNFSEVNLGCKQRIATGLDWVFEQVTEAIILEDDCLPHPSFFPYCEELLERYRDEDTIGMINGSNFQFGQKRGEASYYFSRFPHVWGWASWRRAWKDYDINIHKWPNLRKSEWFNSFFEKNSERNFWIKYFNKVYNKKIDTWDYQWTLSNWITDRLIITPNINLISNIGFDREATHTQGASLYANLDVENLTFPLHHPANIERDVEADNYTGKTFFSNALFNRVFRKIKAIVNNFRKKK
jgi:hypothetical protein